MNQEDLYNVILAPHVSEKTTNVADKHRQYVFRVHPSANKPTIKKAVELMFKVEVQSVTVLNARGKVKGSQRHYGFRAASKKAYVRLKEGHDIDFVGA
jgi:large subunit ribosomal protein L23